MASDKSFHSICRWTFNSGKGGFVPKNMIPEWSNEKLDTIGVIELINEKIKPRLPDNIILGIELHYNDDVNENNAEEIAGVLKKSNIYLAMISPGENTYFAYGGIASLDSNERKKAEELIIKTVDLAYNDLNEAWHSDYNKYPSLVIGNGSYGYDLASVGIRQMYKNLKESVKSLCDYEKKKGEHLFIVIEPKSNEGHPAMLLPTVSSAIIFWKKLKEEFNISNNKKGINKKFSHSEMIGLDNVLDTVEEIENSMLLHMHVNSQGYSDGIIMGGPGKFDMNHGVRINGMNIAIALLAKQAYYSRWKGHDIQVRPYDDQEKAIERIIRSILSWEACEIAAKEFDHKQLLQFLSQRDTIKAEDLIRDSVMNAYNHFKELYNG